MTEKHFMRIVNNYYDSDYKDVTELAVLVFSGRELMDFTEKAFKVNKRKND